MDEIKLKPCPFCGGEAKIIVSGGCDGEDCLVWVCCDECGAESALLDSTEEATAAWNRRAEHG